MLPSDLACVGLVLYHALGSWKISAGIQWHTGAKMHLPAGIFLQTKEESKKSRS